jgi:hypothetical protein
LPRSDVSLVIKILGYPKRTMKPGKRSRTGTQPGYIGQAFSRVYAIQPSRTERRTDNAGLSLLLVKRIEHRWLGRINGIDIWRPSRKLKLKLSPRICFSESFAQQPLLPDDCFGRYSAVPVLESLDPFGYGTAQNTANGGTGEGRRQRVLLPLGEQTDAQTTKPAHAGTNSSMGEEVLHVSIHSRSSRLDEPTHDPAGNSRAREEVGGFRRVPT